MTGGLLSHRAIVIALATMNDPAIAGMSPARSLHASCHTTITDVVAALYLTERALFQP